MLRETVNAAAGISAELACEAAFARIMQDCACQIDAQLAVVLTSDWASGPHKARVALRRLTTALDAFGAILRRKPAARLRAEAKWIFRVLGQLRDADVFVQSCPANAVDGAARRKLAALRAKIRRKLRRHQAVAFAPGVLRQLGDLAHLGETDPEGDAPSAVFAASHPGKSPSLLRRQGKGRQLRRMPVAALAHSQLQAAWKQGLRYGPDLEKLGATGLHDFRKDMKTLRYLVEFFAPLWPAAARAPFRRSLQLLQDDLGLLNDMAVAAARGRRPDAVKRQAALARAARDWRQLRAQPPFWQALPPQIDAALRLG